MPDPIHPVLDRGFVTLIDEPNSDLKVVNAARVSFAKKSTVFEERDAKLIQYLARNNHWTPFAHVRTRVFGVFGAYMVLRMLNEGGAAFRPSGNGFIIDDEMGMCFGGWLSFSLAHAMDHSIPSGLFQPFKRTCPISLEALRPGSTSGDSVVTENDEWFSEEPVTLHIKMPVFVARQWMRSNVGIVYNEVSRRYVDDPPELHVPAAWRKRPDKSIKQGSSDEIVNIAHRPAAYEEILDEYDYLLSEEVAPEQARIVLPVSHYTEFWMTCSLRALARVLKLRLDPHAQWEVREYAKAVRDLVAPKYPILEAML